MYKSIISMIMVVMASTTAFAEWHMEENVDEFTGEVSRVAYATGVDSAETTEIGIFITCSPDDDGLFVLLYAVGAAPINSVNPVIDFKVDNGPIERLATETYLTGKAGALRGVRARRLAETSKAGNFILVRFTNDIDYDYATVKISLIGFTQAHSYVTDKCAYAR